MSRPCGMTTSPVMAIIRRGHPCLLPLWWRAFNWLDITGAFGIGHEIGAKPLVAFRPTSLKWLVLLAILHSFPLGPRSLVLVTQSHLETLKVSVQSVSICPALRVPDLLTVLDQERGQRQRDHPLRISTSRGSCWFVFICRFGHTSTVANHAILLSLFF